jgi:DUF971 family protein
LTDTDGKADRVTPVDVKVRRAQGQVIVAWKDGRTTAFDTLTLRKHCPCAGCRTERERSSPTTELFPILKKDPGLGPPHLIGAKLVGSYAIQLIWADGHDTGIYDFRYLRSLDSLAGPVDQ